MILIRLSFLPLLLACLLLPVNSYADCAPGSTYYPELKQCVVDEPPTPQEECESSGKYWYNGSCHDDLLECPKYQHDVNGVCVNVVEDCAAEGKRLHKTTGSSPTSTAGQLVAPESGCHFTSSGQEPVDVDGEGNNCVQEVSGGQWTCWWNIEATGERDDGTTPTENINQPDISEPVVTETSTETNSETGETTTTETSTVVDPVTGIIDNINIIESIKSDGTKTTTSTTTTTNDSGITTTTTTKEVTAPDGTKTVVLSGQSETSTDEPPPYEATLGDCSTSLSCKGDAILCSILESQKKQQCALENAAKTVESDLAALTGSSQKLGDGTDFSIPDAGEVDLSSYMTDITSVSDVYVGSCPADRTISLSIGTYQVSYSFLCDFASSLSGLVLLIFGFISARIVLDGINRAVEG